MFKKLCDAEIISEKEKEILTNPSEYTFMTKQHVNAYGYYRDNSSIEFYIAPERLNMKKELNKSFKHICIKDDDIYEFGEHFVCISCDDDGVFFNYDIHYKITDRGIVGRSADLPPYYLEHIDVCRMFKISYHPVDWSIKDHAKYRLKASIETYDAIFS